MIRHKKVFFLAFLLLGFLKLNSMDFDLQFELSYSVKFIKKLKQKHLEDIRDFISMTRMRKRDLARTCISKLNPENANIIMRRINNKSEELDLSDLQITAEQLAFILPVIRLDWVGSIFRSKKLKKINLSNNLIDYVDKESFKGLETVEVIDLSNNNLTKVRMRNLKGLKKLQKIKGVTLV